MVINIRKIIHFLGNIGKMLSLIILFFLIATILVSFKLANENVSNPFCLNKYEDVNVTLEYQEIVEYDYYFECSTLYFDLTLKDDLKQNQIISLLVSIGQQIQDLDCFTHFQILVNQKIMYATVDLKTLEVHYVF